MTPRSPSSLRLGESRAIVAAPRAAVRAYLAVLAALGGLTTGAMMIVAIAANSSGEAERIAATQGDGYAAVLVSALANNLSKPNR